MTNFHVRSATETDIDEILTLITDLAIYEKEPEAVKATPDLIRQNVFEKKFAHVFIAVEGVSEHPGPVIGIALYFFNFSTWTGKPGIYLEDLFVKQTHRNIGVGKALFAALGQVALENDCARIDWSVLKWNEPSIKFYVDVLGAKSMTEWMGMRLEGDGIAQLAGLGTKK